MRTKNSIKNAFVAVLMSIITVLVGFISQKVFVNCLGTEYLGLNGLFSNILSILSVAEMGFGTAIIYNLYKPIAENDYNKIKSLLYFYKKIYRIIAFIILILGIVILPFLNTIIGKTTIPNIHFLFLLSLIEVVASYLLTYKRSILYANQKNYIINIIHIFYIIILNLIQILFLIITKNYVVYLLFKLVFRIIENIVITYVANKKYPYITEKNIEKIDDLTKNSIFSKVKGLIYHNIAGALVQGTDNILISKMFGVAVVGLYSNYYLIINSINNLLTQLFQSLTASIGNLLIENDEHKSYQIYKSLFLINSWIYCVTSTCLIGVITDFVSIWMGTEYTLPFYIVLTIIINYYIQGLRKTNSVFKNAAGIFYEDRYIAIIESILNIFFSVLFGRLFGLAGIFFGTIASSFVLFIYSYPVLVYKKIFKRKYYQFFVDLFQQIIISVLICFTTIYICNKIVVSSILTIIIKSFAIFVVSNLLYFLFNFKTKQFTYIKYKLLRRSVKNEK